MGGRTGGGDGGEAIRRLTSAAERRRMGMASGRGGRAWVRSRLRPGWAAPTRTGTPASHISKAERAELGDVVRCNCAHQRIDT